MSGTGLTFTGVIGVGQLWPDVIYASTNSGVVFGGTLDVAVGPPVGIRAGDAMVACVEGGGFGGGGGPYTLVTDPAWTAVYEDPSSGSDHQIIANLYTKTAGADDEAGTSSYTWSITAPSTQAGMAVALIGWRRQFGTVVSNPSVGYGGAAGSTSSPGGLWQFAYATQRTASGFAEPAPDPVITSTATLFAEAGSGYRSGIIRAYRSHDVDPITASYAGGFDHSRQALVAAAIST